ncbi:MAG: hypothetical protein ACOX1O_00900 [Eggerthellaceae bacterium]|jgi:hypothetical protein
MSTQAARAKRTGGLKAAVAAFAVALFALFALGSFAATQAYADDSSFGVDLIATDDDGSTTTVDTITVDLDKLATTGTGEAIAQYYKSNTWNVLYSTSYVTVDDLLAAAGVTVDDSDIINFAASDGPNKKWKGASLSDLDSGKFYPNYDVSTGDTGDGYVVPAVVALTYASGTGDTPAKALENAKAAEQLTTSCPRAIMGIVSDGTYGGNRLWSNCTSLQVTMGSTTQATVLASLQEEASAVATTIANLDTTDAEAVAAARTAYDALSDYQKSYIGSDAEISLLTAEVAVAEAKATAAESSQAATAEQLSQAQSQLKAAQAALAKKTTTVKVNAKKVTASAIAKAIEKAGGKKKYVKTIVLGKNVKSIAKGSFKNYKKVKTITVKTKKLTKKSVKGSLKGSKVVTVKVNVGKAKADKNYVAKYHKVFAKANVGKKVTVKR